MSKYYPLGTIVRLKEIDVEFMVVSRGCITEDKEQKTLFDYAGCLYPYGLMNKNIRCFNNDDIEEVIFEGYNSAQEEVIEIAIDNTKKQMGYI